MYTSKIGILVVTAMACLGSVGLAAAPSTAYAAGSNFVTVKSSMSYAKTVSALQRAVKHNGLMVLGKVDQKAILSMTGLHLQGDESFLVGNPRVGKKLFSMNPAVAAVIPARISVWVGHGKTYVGYFKPSALMGAISNKLAKPGRILDKKFRMIVAQATK